MYTYCIQIKVKPGTFFSEVFTETCLSSWGVKQSDSNPGPLHYIRGQVCSQGSTTFSKTVNPISPLLWGKKPSKIDHLHDLHALQVLKNFVSNLEYVKPWYHQGWSL